jgi:hypothetical protein
VQLVHDRKITSKARAKRRLGAREALRRSATDRYRVIRVKEVVMRCMSQLVGVLVALSGFAACDAEHAVDEPTAARSYLKNAALMNGVGLNGELLNGVSLNGVTLNGVTLNGVTLNGVTLNGVTLNGSSFSATRVIDGVPYTISGAELKGARFAVTTATGTFRIQFDEIQLDPYNAAGDVYLYDISVHDLVNNTTAPLCTHNGDPAPAIPIVNSWDLETGARHNDSTVVTFACRGGALAKCIDWGYRPWAASERCDGGACETVSLADVHQACTRMVRADYCGNGVPHTTDGTLIDVFDHLTPSLQVRSSTEGVLWEVEAEWGPDGAVCIGKALRLEHLDELGIPYELPACLDELDEIPDCGGFNPERGALLADAYCHAWGSDPKSCDPSS